VHNQIRKVLQFQRHKMVHMDRSLFQRHSLERKRSSPSTL
jgi:hypothetical protein